MDRCQVRFANSDPEKAVMPSSRVIFTRLHGESWKMHLPSGRIIEKSPTTWCKEAGANGFVTAQVSFIENGADIAASYERSLVLGE